MKRSATPVVGTFCCLIWQPGIAEARSRLDWLRKMGGWINIDAASVRTMMPGWIRLDTHARSTRPQHIPLCECLQIHWSHNFHRKANEMSKILATLIAGLFAVNVFAQAAAPATPAVAAKPAAKTEAKSEKKAEAKKAAVATKKAEKKAEAKK